MNTQGFKQQLQDQARTLQLDTERLAEAARAGGASEVRDYTDQATASQEASEAAQEEALASQTLVEVQDALQRIDAGTYGRCLRCGCEIPPLRLRATPSARYCVEDQEMLDRTPSAERVNALTMGTLRGSELPMAAALEFRYALLLTSKCRGGSLICSRAFLTS